MPKHTGKMRIFMCHSHEHSDYVIEVAKFLLPQLDGGIFCYETRTRGNWVRRIDEELGKCNIIVVFANGQLSDWQIEEITNFRALSTAENPKEIVVCLFDNIKELPEGLRLAASRPRIEIGSLTPRDTAIKICHHLEIPFIDNGLPVNPHLFTYEKKIIDYFIERTQQSGNPISEEVLERQIEGCPIKWPKVKRWEEENISSENEEKEPNERIVLAAALGAYHKPTCGINQISGCMLEQGFHFPEAIPQKNHYFPNRHKDLRVGIVVSGGIAPGINAVIDGIVKRHKMAAIKHDYVRQLHIFGIRNGFLGLKFLANPLVQLDTIIPAQYAGDKMPSETIITSKHVGEGGSCLGTSRYDDLIVSKDRNEILMELIQRLAFMQFDIFYVIGGDGSMKAAHALQIIADDAYRNNVIHRRISIIGVPKTMDNDILWVWQSFGFLSAVEKARESIEHLGTEVDSNPRLCIVQLFGSDSGFVVSHAVLSSRCECDVALIPEMNFSIKGLVKYLRSQMRDRAVDPGKRIPHGLVVMAETAIPTDVQTFLDGQVDLGFNEREMDALKENLKKMGQITNSALQEHIKKLGKVDVDLSKDERNAVEDYLKKNRRVQGQTSDFLRSAGLKIVRHGLDHLLSQTPELPGDPDWSKLRVFTNEPRHLLRAIPPSSTDIIFGNRLGTLAVDNALAGYKDFMISQWLTEYVLVPLELVVLGRKRIPDGMFWQSVRAKTGQPADLELPDTKK